MSFRYDPLGRRISKTRQQLLQGRPSERVVTTRFVWEGYRLLQEIHDEIPLIYVYSDSQSYEPLARIDGVESPKIFWFHCAANGRPELLTDVEDQKIWEGVNSPWGKLLRESNQRIPVVEQNLRMQGQYLDRETGLHYNLFRYYDPDSGRFTQHDPIGLAGGLNTYAYAPDPLSWIDPLGLSRCSTHKDVETPYGPATQSTAPEALAARSQVENGATLYRVGTTGRSETVGAQFWALEHPHSPGYANRYGIPQENVDRSNFLMTARLKPGAEFVTRPAPGVGENLGGIEVVVPPDAVDIQNFNLF
ncbi:RHS repeat-associated core domain-containing protein [Pantoea ananatis]|nr:RHS repeat-associated core domain-containing protein [Pantoea ananatis]